MLSASVCWTQCLPLFSCPVYPLGRQKAGAGGERRLKLTTAVAHPGHTSTPTAPPTNPPSPLPGEALEGPFRAALGSVCTFSQFHGAVPASKHQLLRPNTEASLEACGQFVPVFSM